MPNPLNARSLLLVFLISILSPPAWTQVEGLAIWSPGGAVSYVVPKIRRMTLHEEMDWYQRNLRASAVYGGMENAQGLNLSTESATFSRVPESTSEHPIVGVILNRPMQMTSKSSYLPTAISAFQKWGPRLFAVPVGLETLLTAEEMAEFRRRLNRFDGQLGVGGDDPHPLTYQQTDTAKTRGDISVERDLAQMAYIKEYLKNGKGRVFYVCGSMQRAAILDGHGFHGDLGHLSDEPQQGPYGPRMLEVVAEAESEIALAAQATQFMTSSFHHAGLDALNPQDSERPPTSKVTAYNISGDGSRGAIAKAIEFPDGAGFATQFHPEFEGSEAEANIVRYVAKGWQMRGRYSPKEISNCIEGRLDSMLTHLSDSAP